MTGEIKKKGSSRNRQAGNGYERYVAKTVREIGHTDIKCSRECSRKRDSQKVDLCSEDEDENGRFYLNVQCKNLNTLAKYPKLLKELETHNGRKHINVVFHKMTEKVGEKFMPRGEFAILNLDDFYRIMQLLKDNDLDKQLIQPK